MTFNVRLAPGANPDRLREKLASLEGVRRVTQVFPGDPDEELARMFIVEWEGDNASAGLLALERMPEVELAEAAPSRKLL